MVYIFIDFSPFWSVAKTEALIISNACLCVYNSNRRLKDFHLIEITVPIFLQTLSGVGLTQIWLLFCFGHYSMTLISCYTLQPYHFKQISFKSVAPILISIAIFDFLVNRKCLQYNAYLTLCFIRNADIMCLSTI